MIIHNRETHTDIHIQTDRQAQTDIKIDITVQ